MTTDFEFVAYYNTRVHGMQSALFSHAQLDSLLQQDEIGVLVDFLLNSPYDKDMAESLERLKGGDAVELAVSTNMAKTFGLLLERATGRFAEFAHLFFARWDLIVVKTLLRARHQGLDPDAAANALLSGPNLTPETVYRLARCADMETLIGALAVWNPALCACLKRAFPEYENERRIAVLEDALDGTYFAGNAAQLASKEDEDSRCLRRFFQMEIDRINLRTVIQTKGGKESPQQVVERILPEGGIHRETLVKMALAQDVVEAMECLGSTPYTKLVEGLYRHLETKRFTPLERVFDFLLVRELRRMARVHVFTVAVVMHYVWLKHNEVTNLRLIARGHGRHLTLGRIREEMVYA